MRIRSKLLTIVLSATAAALLLAGAVLFAFDQRRVRRELLEDLAATGALLAANSTAALAFEDPIIAAQNLESLSSQPHVVAGCLYRARGGDLFASYPDGAAGEGPCPERRRFAPPGFRDGAAEHWTPVVLDGRPIGSLFLRSDLRTLRQRQLVQLWTLAGVLAVALTGGFLLSLPLQRLVARPIRDLAATAQAITRRRDYSLRARRLTADEVGDLVAAFNRMLDEIESTDASLREAKREADDANVGLRHEVTERERAEQEKARLLEREREARREAEVANRLKDEFLATLSHELRTPLNAILGWVALLQAGKTDPETLGRAAGVIERNARAQAQLVDDLLDVSRVVAGKLSLEVRPTDLAGVLHEVEDVVRPAAAAKRIRLGFEIDDELPRLRADPARLQQIVWNLVSNAIKFTPEGGAVRVRARRSDDRVEIVVSDEGVGIDPEFLPHVFERFRQQDSSTTRYYGGLGLGLAIVRHLVELHGGEVTAESDGAGHGATFRISLPLHAVVEESSAGAPEDGGLAGLHGLHVLLVEDEPDAREIYRLVLEAKGARVRAVASAEEALRAFDDEPPDLLVSDIGLPGTDGYSLIREIRRRPSPDGGAVPAIALTAYAGESDRRSALEAGFQTHVAKPVGAAELVRSVKDLIEEP